MEAVNNPEDPTAGTRKVPFSRVLYIEQDDFREDPPHEVLPPVPGREVRLRYGYFITCTERGKERQRRRRRSPLHLRSRHPRRQRSARRPQGEVDHPLGLGRARHRRRSSPLRQPVHQRRSRIDVPKARTSPLTSIRIRSKSSPTAKLEPSLGQRHRRRLATSSSASATSASIPTPLRESRSSTARSR